MKPTQTRRQTVPHYVRKPHATDRDPPAGDKKAQETEAPFREGDVVEYVASPSRRFIVAHCYARGSGSGRHWVVAEVNANTHPADELRRVTLA